MAEESCDAEGVVTTKERSSPPKYQIELTPKGTADPQEMVDKVMGDLKKHRIRAILHARRNLRTNETREPDSFSLTDIPLRRFRKDVENPIIEDTVGSLIVRGSLAESRMGSFYTPDRIYRHEDGGVELRGANYFVSVDANKNLPSEKLDTMERDFRDALSVLEQVNRPQNEKEFLMYLGALDYLKIHSLSVLHAVTYDERNSQLAQDEGEREDYLQTRKDAVDLMRASVRKYYQAASGLPFDSGVSLENMGSKMEELTRYLRKNIRDDEAHKFTYPDINNSIVILLGAHEAALQNPDVQIIVGLASGGTESAVATQLFYEVIHGKSPDLVILPISFHSKRRSKITTKKSAEMFQQLYPDKFKDKSVLLIDDNSSSGATLQTADNIVKSLGSVSTEVHIAQHDPERVKDRVKKSNTRHVRIFNMTHPKYQTTIGVVPVDSGNSYDTTPQIIKSRLKAYYASLK